MRICAKCEMEIEAGETITKCSLQGCPEMPTQRSATGATIERLRALVKKIDDEPMRLSEPAVSVAIGRCQVADEMRAILDSTDSGKSR